MSNTRKPRLVDLDDCPCSGGNLERLIQPAVLAVLARGPLHGYRIVQRLAKDPLFGGDTPDPTGVYRILKAMQTRGLVTASWDLSASGPARRQFELTGGGRACVKRWIASLERYRARIDGVVKMLRKSGGRKDRV